MGGPSARERLVEATVELLTELTAADLVTAIGTRQIAERAGTSAATLFHHFGSVAGLAEAVVARVYTNGRTEGPVVNEVLADLVRSSLPADTGRALHLVDFERNISDPEFRLRVGLWALGGPVANDAYAAFLHTLHEDITASVEAVFAAWGREVRPPFTTRSFIAAQGALLNGATAWHLADPTLLDAEDFARVATALTLASLRVEGDPHDLDDRLAELNYYPLRDLRSGRRLTDPAARTRASIVAAAGEHVATGDGVSIAKVARQAGVSTSTVYDHFAGVEQLLAALFRKQVEDRVLTRTAGMGAPADQLRDHLEDVARFVATHVDQARPYLSDLVCHTPAPPEGDVLRETTRDLVAAAGLRPDLDPADLADQLLASVLSRVLGHPREGADAVTVVWATFALG